MPQHEMPKIFKNTNRCSRGSMPQVGATCMFSHGHRLSITGFVPQAKEFDRPEIHQGARCEVLGFVQQKRHPNIVVVKFSHADQEDLVSPECLIPLVLTQFGYELFQSSPELLATLSDIECRKDRYENN